MSAPKHTAGPWEVFICDDGKQWTGWPLSITAAYDDDKTVVRTGGQWPYEWGAAISQREAVANAHLIAAAPEMLEALRQIAEMTEDYSPLTGNSVPTPVSKLARAAIAKAEGQQ